MKIISIKPDKRTKISDGTCTIKAMGNTHVIHITDEDNKLLLTTYANNISEVKSNKAIYAEATKYPISIEVDELNPKKEVSKPIKRVVNKKAIKE